MKKLSISFSLVILLAMPNTSFAWGKTGHQLVAKIALHFLSPKARKAVEKGLRNISFVDAATWMDDMKSDNFYNYMRTWHYADIPKDSVFKPSTEKNAITVLNAAIQGLMHKESLGKNDLQNHLLYLFHLIGDLHQPLHVGYPNDRGGNDVKVDYLNKGNGTNLHSVWDTEIIESQNINLDSCLNLYATLRPTEVDSIKQINVLKWFRESRSIVEPAYKFENGFLNKDYVSIQQPIIEMRLLYAGIRLAAVLEKAFG